MEQNKLCASDYKFMQLVWESEPICSGDLVKLSFDKLGCEYVVNNKFGGSLPAFIASFMRTKKLTEKEAEEIRHLIDNTAEDVQW